MRISRITKPLLILVFLSGVSSIRANDSVDAAIYRLSIVERFAFGGVGYAGGTSRGEIDFKSVVAQPPSTAVSAFERLYATGNPQGKSYALSGFKKLEPRRFKELAATLEKSTDQVEVMRGCIVSREALRDVAKQIDQGKFRF